MEKPLRFRAVVGCFLAWLLVYSFGATTKADSFGEVLIAPGSIWKYWDRGGALPSAWTSRFYDDTQWASGPAQLGYGDGDEATVVSFGPDPDTKYTTTYFRRGFV